MAFDRCRSVSLIYTRIDRHTQSALKSLFGTEGKMPQPDVSGVETLEHLVHENILARSLTRDL
jgi:hypothetical protein